MTEKHKIEGETGSDKFARKLDNMFEFIKLAIVEPKKDESTTKPVDLGEHGDYEVRI